MKVELISHTPDPERTIARCAAVCYDADTSPEACERRLKNILKMKHLATLRFAHATFYIEGISRITSHQLVRAKHLDFLQESQRYVMQGDLSYVQPDTLADVPEGVRTAWARLEQFSKDVYAESIAAGMKKEDARYALLHSAPTKLYVTGSFQAWADFLKNRLDKSAQREIQAVAREIAWYLSRIAPNIFENSAVPA